jgi:hypothetical protein
MEYLGFFSNILKLAEHSGYNCLSGKELAASVPDKPKSMEYNNLRRSKTKRKFFRSLL